MKPIGRPKSLKGIWPMESLYAPSHDRNILILYGYLRKRGSKQIEIMSRISKMEINRLSENGRFI
tara:strand:+ start:25810 stop:26004 length:195 start_codon:yes stop_codon:yes gene_type:complete